MSTTIDAPESFVDLFAEHLDTCKRCQENPANLCIAGFMLAQYATLEIAGNTQEGED